MHYKLSFGHCQFLVTKCSMEAAVLMLCAYGVSCTLTLSWPVFPMVSTWVVSWGPSGISKISLNSVFTWTCPLSHSSPFPVPQVLSWLHLGHDEESHIFPFSLSVRKNYCSFLSVCIGLAFLCCPSVSVCNPDVSSLPLQATSNISKERAEALLVSGIDEPLLQMQVLQSHSKGLKQLILVPKYQYNP